MNTHHQQTFTPFSLSHFSFSSKTHTRTHTHTPDKVHAVHAFAAPFPVSQIPSTNQSFRTPCTPRRGMRQKKRKKERRKKMLCCLFGWRNSPPCVFFFWRKPDMIPLCVGLHIAVRHLCAGGECAHSAETATLWGFVVVPCFARAMLVVDRVCFLA